MDHILLVFQPSCLNKHKAFKHKAQDFEIHIVKRKIRNPPFLRFQYKLWKTIFKVELQALGWLTMLRNEDDTLDVNMDIIPKKQRIQTLQGLMKNLEQTLKDRIKSTGFEDPLLPKVKEYRSIQWTT